MAAASCPPDVEPTRWGRFSAVRHRLKSKRIDIRFYGGRRGSVSEPPASAATPQEMGIDFMDTVATEDMPVPASDAEAVHPLVVVAPPTDARSSLPRFVQGETGTRFRCGQGQTESRRPRWIMRPAWQLQPRLAELFGQVPFRHLSLSQIRGLRLGLQADPLFDAVCCGSVARQRGSGIPCSGPELSAHSGP